MGVKNNGKTFYHAEATLHKQKGSIDKKSTERCPYVRLADRIDTQLAVDPFSCDVDDVEK